ncbi:20815_t:CDS:2 [Cetraspora pellucida]|uniref:20815_t:CDS:1 n=1 Tax=Cetraspora pellucida TaxID=1433469 RepID=A0A9N9KC22_9GLOM|nr:20815_t:CDS:2 [Cetraspora pellucida]
MYESKFIVNVDLNIHRQAAICHADVELDLYGSLGKRVMRFQMVAAAFPFIIVVMTMRAQLREYDRGGPFLSFGHGLALFIRQTFLKFLVIVSLLSIYKFVTKTSKAYSLVDLFPMDYASGDMQKAIKAKASFNVNVNDTLLGN